MKRNKLVMLNAVRFLAALGIIWNHSMRDATEPLASMHSAGMFCVSFFTLASIYLLVTTLSRKMQPLAENTANRFKRIYVPFLIWSGVYFIVKNINNIAAGKAPMPITGDVAFWGTQAHLWFLPFIFMAGFVAYFIARWSFGNASRELFSGLATLVLGVWSAFALQGIDLETWQYVQCLMVVPAALMGVAFAYLYRRVPQTLSQSPWVLWSALAIAALSTWHVALNGRSPVYENIGGVGLMIFALAPWDNSWIRAAEKLGMVSYAVYLGHELAIGVFRLLGHKLHLQGHMWFDFTVWIGAAVATFIGAFMYQRVQKVFARTPAPAHA